MATRKFWKDEFIRDHTSIDRYGNRVTTFVFKDRFLIPRGLDPRMPVDEAFDKVYYPHIRRIEQNEKVVERLRKRFDKLRMKGKIEYSQSQKSESIYYYKNGFKFRFSGHRHPTGSMTQFVYDDGGNVIGGTIDMTDSNSAELARKYAGLSLTKG